MNGSEKSCGRVETRVQFVIVHASLAVLLEYGSGPGDVRSDLVNRRVAQLAHERLARIEHRGYRSRYLLRACRNGADGSRDESPASSFARHVAVDVEFRRSRFDGVDSVANASVIGIATARITVSVA